MYYLLLSYSNQKPLRKINANNKAFIYSCLTILPTWQKTSAILLFREGKALYDNKDWCLNKHLWHFVFPWEVGSFLLIFKINLHLFYEENDDLVWKYCMLPRCFLWLGFTLKKHLPWKHLENRSSRQDFTQGDWINSAVLFKNGPPCSRQLYAFKSMWCLSNQLSIIFIYFIY